MNLLSFFKKFPTEEICKKHFIAQRLSIGIVCKKCQCKKHYWLAKKEQFQCSNCSFRTTLRSETALQSSKLSYLYWFAALHFMSATKKGFSAYELQRQLGHKRYEPIWYLMQKIRKSMGNNSNQFKLEDTVSIDDAYVSTHTPAKEKLNLKRGKGSQKKSKITTIIETIPLEIRAKKSVFMG